MDFKSSLWLPSWDGGLKFVKQVPEGINSDKIIGFSSFDVKALKDIESLAKELKWSEPELITTKTSRGKEVQYIRVMREARGGGITSASLRAVLGL